MPNTEPEQALPQVISPERIHVAAAVIVGEDGKILLSKRLEHLHQGGLWEFPGGKVDSGESVGQALYRELREELSIIVEQGAALIQISHDYSDKKVLLDFWKVTAFSGEPVGNEGQLIRWVAVENLADYPFPKANQPVVDMLMRLDATEL